MRRSVPLLTSMVLAMLAMTSPVRAVSNGQLDGNRHPNVACVLGRLPDGSFVGCGTGQLIASRVVLVAAHEFPVLEGLGATRFFVSFDSSVEPETSELFAAKRVVSHPDFNPISFSGEDLGVLLLSKPVTGVTPIQLPTAGLLDRMKEAGTLRSQQFIVVGYGVDCTATVPCPVGFDTTRRAAAEAFISIQRETFILQANHQATGEGGLCWGDSGSPHLLGNSNVSAGVTHLPNGNCNSAAAATRLDTRAARSFLGRFVTLP